MDFLLQFLIITAALLFCLAIEDNRFRYSGTTVTYVCNYRKEKNSVPDNLELLNELIQLVKR